MPFLCVPSSRIGIWIWMVLTPLLDRVGVSLEVGRSSTGRLSGVSFGGMDLLFDFDLHNLKRLSYGLYCGKQFFLCMFLKVVSRRLHEHPRCRRGVIGLGENLGENRVPASPADFGGDRQTHRKRVPASLTPSPPALPRPR